MTMHTIPEAGPPRHLLAIDIGAFIDPADEGLVRLSDRIASIRLSTVLVFIDGTGFAALPEPDYVIDPEAPQILRMPTHEAVSDWPKKGKAADIESAVAHLAEALLVTPSEVYLVAGSHRRVRKEGELEHVIVLGGMKPPPRGTWVDEASGGAVVNALEEEGLFGRPTPAAPDIRETAFEAALDSLRRNLCDIGFTAASIADNPLSRHDANYASVWARDGIITGLWTMCLDDAEMTEAFRRTVRLLVRHQAPSGQIPSNVRLEGEEPDYSGIGGIGSIDSVLWFVVGAVRLAMQTRDRGFAEEIVEPVSRAMTWLAAHDANNDGLIEIPESSDWMDIFPRSYAVLYDEVLWYQACSDTAVLYEALGRDGSGWRKQSERIRDQILRLFWPSGEQLMEIAGQDSGRFTVGEAYYLLSQITPFDYGWRCDVYANLLAGLCGLLDDAKRDRLFTFLWGVGVNIPFPAIVLYPPILSGAEDWKDYFLVNFLNLPDHYHNGGIWPFIGGLWIRFLAATDRVELAHRELVNLAEACRQGIRGEWEFNEWLHGRTGRPMGKAHQAWSAASYVHAYLTLNGDATPPVFPALDPAALSS